MTVYLIDIETNEVKTTYDNVIEWGFNFVEYMNGGYRAKTYCDTETEYFSDKYEEVDNTDTD